MFDREHTKKIKIRDKYIGGSNHIYIQSMCNISTKQVDKVINQILELEKNGCEIIRIAVKDEEEANNISKIKSKIHIPLVADIHFDYKLAILSVKNGVDKVRINPGNIGDEEKVKEVAKVCKTYNVPIRVGVNSGSVSKEILSKYDGKINEYSLVEEAEEEIKILNKYDFDDIIISIKSSDIKTCIKSYELFADKYKYPLHLGITESGNLMRGSIKSSIGLGIMLNDNIGNTIRVSLTSDPINEVKTAKIILNNLNLRDGGIEIISCPTCGRTQIDVEKLSNYFENVIEEYDNIAYLKNKKLKIAIMGCAVNGPGEAKEADIGIAGGNGEGLIFKKGKIIKKVKENMLKDELLKELKQIIEIDT